MSRLLRFYAHGQIYFVTVIAHQRKAILIDHYDPFWNAVEKVRFSAGFGLIAHVVLPNHFHFIIDPKSYNLSVIIKRIKLVFSHCYRSLHGLDSAKLWQPQFWDHIIRDQNDMNRHIDYIHYNPVKHGFVATPFEWRYSSVHEYLEEGHYSSDWGRSEGLKLDGDFGEFRGF